MPARDKELYSPERQQFGCSLALQLDTEALPNTATNSTCSRAHVPARRFQHPIADHQDLQVRHEEETAP
jgi:hypothetical protein